MVREWLIGGRHYGSDGQNLRVATARIPRRTGSASGAFVHEDEPVPTLVVEASLVSANRPGLPVRLWGCRMRIAYESVTAIAMSTLRGTDVALFDLVLPRRNGLQIARRLRTKDGFRKADLIALRSSEPCRALLHTQEPHFDFHLVKPMNPAELRQLRAAVEDERLVAAL